MMSQDTDLGALFVTHESEEAFDHAFDRMLARWESARRAMFEIGEDGDPVA